MEFQTQEPKERWDTPCSPLVSGRSIERIYRSIHEKEVKRRLGNKGFVFRHTGDFVSGHKYQGDRDDLQDKLARCVYL